MNSFALMLFVLRVRAFQQFHHGLIGLVLRLLAGLYVLLQGALLVFLLNRFAEPGLSGRTFIGAIDLFVALVILLRNFLPIYRPTSALIKAFYPVSRQARAALSAGYDVLSLFLFGVIGFYLVLLSSAVYTLYDLTASLLVALSILWVERSLRLIIDYRFAARAVHGLLAFLLGGAVVSTVVLRMAVGSGLAWGFLAAGLAVVHHAWLAYGAAGPEQAPARRLPGSKRQPAASESPMLLPVARLACLRNKLIRLSIGLALLMKTLTLVAFSAMLAKEVPFKAFEILFFVGVSPLVLFTYVYNNAFGYAPALWQTVYLKHGSFASSFATYLWLLVPPLVLDALVTLPFIWLAGFSGAGLGAFYVGSFFGLTALGFGGSIVKPVKVEALFSFSNFKSNVSPVITYGLSVPFVLGCALLLETQRGAWSLGAGVAVFSIVMTWIGIRYHSLKHKTYVELHR